MPFEAGSSPDGVHGKTGAAAGLAPCVEAEYGTLREVIVGRTEGFRLPKLGSAGLAEYAQFLPAGEVEFLRNGQGQVLRDYAPDFAAAMDAQVERLVALLRGRDVVVHRPRPLTEAEESFPGFAQRGGSLLFMRDPLLVIGRRIIELAMRFPFRRRHRFALREIVAAKDAPLLSMPEPLPTLPEAGFGPSDFLEGGDVLLNGKEVYVGVSGHASSAGGAHWLQRLLQEEARVFPVELTDGILHLDCALSIPRPGLVIACREAFPQGLPGVLRSWDVIDVTYEEATHLACNGLIVDSNTYVIDAAHGPIAERLAAKGLDVIEIPFDLPTRFGGGLRCVHHPLVRTY